eukprot:m51a1_g11322 hypothetical protein (241) ;mRNA; r:118437-119634
MFGETPFPYRPYSWRPPVPPPGPAEPPFKETASVMAPVLSSISKSLNSALKSAKDSVYGTFFRNKFNIPRSEPLLYEFTAKSTDVANVVYDATVLIFGEHLCFALAQKPSGARANVAIPLQQVLCWRRAATDRARGAPEAAPPQVSVCPEGRVANAVHVYTADGCLHLLWDFFGYGPTSALRFMSTLDVAWRKCCPPAAAPWQQQQQQCAPLPPQGQFPPPQQQQHQQQCAPLPPQGRVC